jgi:hypothetical protein
MIYVISWIILGLCGFIIASVPDKEEGAEPITIGDLGWLLLGLLLGPIALAIGTHWFFTESYLGENFRKKWRIWMKTEIYNFNKKKK